MDLHDERIPHERFAEFTAHMPETCVELVLEHEGGVLVARRTNEPAKGEWFWPGTRLYEGEALEAAARRVGREELGIEVAVGDLLGVYAHFWERSSLPGSPSRHTVNVVYRAAPVEDDPRIVLDDQHDDYRILTAAEPELHGYVRRYLADGEFFASNGG